MDDIMKSAEALEAKLAEESEDQEPTETNEEPKEEKEAPSQDEVKAESPEDDFASMLRAHKHKVKIDGEEAEVDYDELLANFQLRQASDKRFAEAAKMRKEIEAAVAELQSNPKKVLSELGIDVSRLAEEIIAERLEDDMLDDKEKEIRALKRQLEEKEAKAKELEEKEKNLAFQQQQQAYAEKYQKEIPEAITAAGLPVNSWTFNRVREYMLEAIENNVNLEAKDVIPYVRKDFEAQMRELITTAPKHLLDQFLNQNKPKTVPMDKQPKPKERKPEKAKTLDDFFADIYASLED